MTLDSSFSATYSEAAELLPIWPAAIGLQK